ncbi:MAG TPA: lysylphosphatidylglycerol synthase domain-containing protein [Polyangiaceae bacterium]|nr:lysylphosphatidylglycerol synthase domain-containing protein [Polyangiaceae bacterium]
MLESRHQRLVSVLGWVAAAALVYFLVRKVLHLDFAHAVELIRRAGLVTVVIALPYPIAMAIDTFTGGLLLATTGPKIRFRVLYAIRLACEAALLSLPVGSALAESLSLFLLYRKAGVAPTRGIAFIVGKRWLLLRAHAFYVLFSGLVGYAILARLSPALIHGAGLPFIVLASTLVPFGLAAAMSATLEGGTAARALGRLAQRIPIASVQSFLKKRAEHFGAADVALARVLRLGKGPIWRYTALLLAAWMMDSIETLIILRILGIQIGFVEVYSFEAGLSLVRSMAFFVPAGLGIQDLGYFAFFTALGIPDALGIGAAFVLLKRTKELFWVVVGYVLLFVLRVEIAQSHVTAARAPS